MAVEWIPLGSDLMKEARERLGLGTEAVARRLSGRGYEIKSGKTYERWEKRGEVPKPALPSLATVLEIEVERPEPLKVKLNPRPEEALAMIAQAALDIDTALQRLGPLLERQERFDQRQDELLERVQNVLAEMQQREAAKR